MNTIISSLSNALFSSSHSPLVICDGNHQIIQTNTAFDKLTEFSDSEVKGKNLQALLNFEHSQIELLRNSLLENNEFTGDITITLNNNQQFKMNILVRIIEDSTQKSACYVYMISEIKNNSELEIYHDQLTGLPNKLLFTDRTEQTLIAASRTNKSVALLMIGLDHFALINDGLGYEVGDQVLISIAERLNHTIRQSDTAARIQGDSFAIVMQITSIEDSVIVAEKVLKILHQSMQLDNNTLSVTASIGISIFPADASTQAELFKNAESTMLYTKKMGGNHYKFFSDEMNIKAKHRIEMENKLRRAIENEEFVVYYQPKVNLVNNAIEGAEALVRWINPEQGLVAPGVFIPIAEETGLINGIGALVLRDACQQNSQWIKQGLPKISVSVNVTASQFRERGLVEQVQIALKNSGLSSQYLELEITESMLVGNMEQVVEKLTALRKMGIKISIDDFGTGYSSLSYLSRFPVTTLKIDRAFIHDIETNESTAEITRAIIALSHGLNLEVVAEGAESLEHISFLRKQGCELVQGFYYSRPLPADEFEIKLTKGYIYD